MPLYFAYGSNMDVDAMGRRCPRSKALGLARLERHRLAVMREGWLTAIRNPSSAVHGVLWDLALSDIPALDRHESLSQGLYVKLTQAVIAERGPKRAIVYFGANSGPGARVRLILLRSWPPQVMAASGGRRRGAGETGEAVGPCFQFRTGALGLRTSVRARIIRWLTCAFVRWR